MNTLSRPPLQQSSEKAVSKDQTVGSRRTVQPFTKHSNPTIEHSVK
ncbi:Uncharacterised protein [Vibrio cholerae]|nr:Uncharacterised protein [Vibrio cholerae]